MAETNTKKTATIETKGDAYVITAGFKYNTIKDLVKFGKASALNLTEKDSKDVMFRVMTDSIGSVSAHGIAFTGANDNGYAEVTGCFPKTSMSADEKKSYLKNEFALILVSLNAVQAQVEAAAKDLDGVMKDVDNAIKIG